MEKSTNFSRYVCILFSQLSYGTIAGTYYLTGGGRTGRFLDSFFDPRRGMTRKKRTKTTNSGDFKRERDRTRESFSTCINECGTESFVRYRGNGRETRCFRCGRVPTAGQSGAQRQELRGRFGTVHESDRGRFHSIYCVQQSLRSTSASVECERKAKYEPSSRRRGRREAMHEN